MCGARSSHLACFLYLNRLMLRIEQNPTICNQVCRNCLTIKISSITLVIFYFLFYFFFSPIFSGYMAPEYALRGYLTDKADVYSYGIVLLEIVSGMPNVSDRAKENHFVLLDRVTNKLLFYPMYLHILVIYFYFQRRQNRPTKAGYGSNGVFLNIS